jgi:hypothetical protein
MTSPMQRAFMKGRRPPTPTFRGAAPDLTRRALAEVSRSSALGTQAENEFFKRAMAFDPQAYAEQSAQGIVGSLTPQFQRNLQMMQGQAAGSGRLETGFFDMDRGRLFEDFNNRVAQAVAANAMQSAGMAQQNIGQIGEFGGNLQNRFINLLGGSLDRATAEENARKEGGGLFGKLLGGALGLVGGPIASAAGSYIGGKIFPGGGQ